MRVSRGVVDKLKLVCLLEYLLFLAAQNIPQFPQGFQAQFANAAANFANYRPQFSVPGQSSAGYSQVR